MDRPPLDLPVLPVPPWTPDVDDPWPPGGGPPTLPWRAHRGWRVRVATGLLWSLIALAAAGGLRGLVAGTPGPAAPKPVPPGPPSGVEGFAQMFVAAWLQAGAGSEASLRPYLHSPVDLAGIPPASRYAARTAVLSDVQVAPGYWSVTVGAEVLAASGGGGYAPGGTHDYQVSVFAGPGAPVATALPAEVAAPVLGPPPALLLASPEPPAPDDPVAGLLQRFLGAYLTGSGEQAGPGNTLAPLNPPPFVGVTLTALATSDKGGSAATAQANVTATDPTGLAQRLEYFFSLSRHLGQWQVDRLLPAAPLAQPHS